MHAGDLARSRAVEADDGLAGCAIEPQMQIQKTGVRAAVQLAATSMGLSLVYLEALPNIVAWQSLVLTPELESVLDPKPDKPYCQRHERLMRSEISCTFRFSQTYLNPELQQMFRNETVSHSCRGDTLNPKP